MKSTSDALKTARPHPFAASADAVAAMQSGDPGSTTLLLPSLRRSPLDSPDLVRIRPRPPSLTGPSLLPWIVPVVWVDAAALTDVTDEYDGTDLASVLFPGQFQNDESPPIDDVRTAPSVRFFGELMRCAGELAERGRVLSGIKWLSDTDEGTGVAQARWRAVPRGSDTLAYGDLVAATPPSFRSEPGSDDAGELIAAALDTLTDAAVRRRLPHDLPLLPPRRGRKPLQLRVAETWLEANAPARATFRLSDSLSTETDDDEEDEVTDASATNTPLEVPQWRLEFMLQSSADPSLIVPAEQVWRDDGALTRWLGRPQEMLLAEPGKAARVYPELEPGLRQSRPTALSLDSDAAFAFLRDAAPALDEAGFGVLLPSWWDRRAKLGLKLVAYLHGGTSRQKRTELVRRFHSDDGPPVFLLSLKAGGTGLNFTAANHVIHLDRWWNPAVENQATDRAFRIGQKRRVQVRKFICRGTLEERIDNMMEEKSALANMVVGDGEGWLTELSTASLRDLFALSKEALSD